MLFAVLGAAISRFFGHRPRHHRISSSAGRADGTCAGGEAAESGGGPRGGPGRVDWCRWDFAAGGGGGGGGGGVSSLAGVSPKLGDLAWARKETCSHVSRLLEYFD